MSDDNHLTEFYVEIDGELRSYLRCLVWTVEYSPFKVDILLHCTFFLSPRCTTVHGLNQPVDAYRFNAAGLCSSDNHTNCKSCAQSYALLLK